MERRLRQYLPGGEFKNVPEQRSQTMAAIRGRGNRTTELRLRLALVRTGVRGWQLHPQHVFGKPDVYFPKGKLVVFVDGCFWHGCPTCGHTPKTNTAFWSAKIRRNRHRDRTRTRQLERQGFTVLRFWEHDVQQELPKSVEKVRAVLARGPVSHPASHPARLWFR